MSSRAKSGDNEARQPVQVFVICLPLRHHSPVNRAGEGVVGQIRVDIRRNLSPRDGALQNRRPMPPVNVLLLSVIAQVVSYSSHCQNTALDAEDTATTILAMIGAETRAVVPI